MAKITFITGISLPFSKLNEEFERQGLKSKFLWIHQDWLIFRLPYKEKESQDQVSIRMYNLENLFWRDYNSPNSTVKIEWDVLYQWCSVIYLWDKNHFVNPWSSISLVSTTEWKMAQVPMETPRYWIIESTHYDWSSKRTVSSDSLFSTDVLGNFYISWDSEFRVWYWIN